MFFYFVLFYYGGPSAAFVKCEALIRINVSFVEREGIAKMTVKGR